MVEPCSHGFPKPANCVDCMYEGNLEPSPAAKQRRANNSTLATFHDHCGECLLDITPGQLIVSVGGEWIHEDCFEWS